MTEPLLWWGIALFGSALLVLALELFIPSGGLLSLLCLGLAVSGVVCFFRVSNGAGLASTGAVLVMGPLAAYFFLKIYPDTPMGRRLILGDPDGRPSGADDPSRDDAGGALVGAEGVAVTDMRPMGTVEIDGKRLEAAAELGLIHAGTKVRVTGVEGVKVRVRAVV